MATETGLHLFLLPLEIREQIYSEILLVEKHRINQPDDLSDPEPVQPPMLETELASKKSRLDMDLRLYHVNKQMYREASAVFSRINTFICVESPFPDTEHNMEEKAGLLMIASGDAARTFKSYHMKCVIDAPEMVVRDCCRFIIALQDLEPFTNLWFYYDIHHDSMLNGHLSLNLEFTQDLPRQLQQLILRPFARIKGLGGFSVSGPHAPDGAAKLREAMAVPYSTPSQCLNDCARLKEEGNTTLKAGNARKALDLYYEAFRSIHMVVEGRRRQIWADTLFECYIPDGLFKGKWGGLVRMTLRIQLVANVVMAYVKLGEYGEAYYWGMRSINLMRNAFGQDGDTPRHGFPASNAVGKIYYRTAIAARDLGKADTARDLIRIAAQWLPDDPIVQRDNAIFGVRQLG